MEQHGTFKKRKLNEIPLRGITYLTSWNKKSHVFQTLNVLRTLNCIHDKEN